MNNKFWKIITIIFTIVVIILATILIILLIRKLSGYSPDTLTILSWTISVLLALQIVIVTILFQIKEDLGNLKEFKRRTIEKIKEIENKI